MDIANLQAFVGVAGQGSFSLAAEALFLTQPAVSKRVGALETELETRLFDRIGRTVQLTEAGRLLLPRAQHILQELEDSRRAIAGLSGEVAGVLAVGTSHHVGLHHLPPVLRSFTTEHVAVELDLRFMDSEAACRAVEQGELELAVVTLPPRPSPRLLSQPLWPDPLHLAVAADHPLARQSRLQLADLAAWPAILPAASTYTRQIAEQAFAPLGLSLKTGLSSNYLETIRMLVSVGLGWSILPATLLDAQVVALPLSEGLQLQRTLGVVHHRDRSQSNAARAFMAHLLRHALSPAERAPVDRIDRRPD
jgi:DNA-binding transcriptional LysR family regulator